MFRDVESRMGWRRAEIRGIMHDVPQEDLYAREPSDFDDVLHSVVATVEPFPLLIILFAKRCHAF